MFGIEQTELLILFVMLAVPIRVTGAILLWNLLWQPTYKVNRRSRDREDSNPDDGSPQERVLRG